MFEAPPEDADFWAWMAHPVWRYSAEPEAAIYAWFNVAEAVAWWALGAYALARFVRHRKTPVELLYVLMFALFGLSDLLESYRVTGWLILAKGLIFANLVVIRLYLVRLFYPGWRL